MRIIVKADVRRWKRMGEPNILRRLLGLVFGVQSFKDPRTGKTYPFSFYEKPDGCTVFTLTREGEVILVRQFKQAVNSIIYEAPGGQLRRGVAPLDIAKEELRQETGFIADRMRQTSPKDGYWLSPRKSRSVSHTFLATGCTLVGPQKLDKGEGAIEVVGCTPEEFWQLVDGGFIRSIETVLAAHSAVVLGAIPFP